MMNQKSLYRHLAAFSLVVGLASLVDTRSIAAAPESSKERVTAGPPVRKTLTLYTVQPGWIRAYEEAPLYPRVNGYVKEVKVDIGDRVEAGQLLLTIDAPELHDDVAQHEALVAQSVAERAQAEAAIAASTAKVRTAEAQLAGVEAGVTRAKGERQRWNAEYLRIKDLAGRGTVTEKLVDETLNQFKSAEAAQAEAEAAIHSTAAAVEEARANVQQAKADLAAAAARIDVAKANLAHAQTMAAYTQIKAPFAGVVTERNVDTGYSVYPYSGSIAKPLFTIARHDVVRVFTDVPETEAELVTAGVDTATVTIQGLGNRSIEAKVTRTGWSLDANNRSLRTELEIPNDKAALRPGMFATVRIKLDERENVLTLPATAIVRDAAGARCCIVVSGKIEHRPIVLGLRSSDDIEVLSGIQESDLVVLARAAGLQVGQAVEVLPPTQ